MSERGQDGTDWQVDPANILNAVLLEKVKRHVEQVGAIAVKHWHYRQASSPTYLAFVDYESFKEYLDARVYPGDAIDVWPFPDGSVDTRIVGGKFPDDRGRTPVRGIY